MSVQQSLVFGLIQGLTEFIPVSSTAHLILAPQLLGVPPLRAEIAHTYDTFIQLGTVLPVLVYFWREWLRLLRAAGRLLRRRGRPGDDLDERLVLYLVVGSVPAGLLGLALDRSIERLADPGYRPAFLIIGSALIVVGLLMWWVEGVARRSRTIEQVRMPDAILVGFAQAMALVPGVSRSGSTITAGLFAGLTREAAARFSFLLMTPIMLAATGYKGLKVARAQVEGGAAALTGSELGSMLLATAVAAVSGYLAIAFLLAWLRTRSLGLFAAYRLVLGAFCVGLYFVTR